MSKSYEKILLILVSSCFKIFVYLYIFTFTKNVTYYASKKSAEIKEIEYFPYFNGKFY